MNGAPVVVLTVAFAAAATAGWQRPDGVRVVPLEASATGPPISVTAGERLLLTWTNAGPDAILAGVGPVPPTGEHEVRPQIDTSYTLISGDGSSVRFRSVFVTIAGGRGAADPADTPGLNQYSNLLKATVAGKPYTALVQGVATLLQDTCGYAVRGDHLPSQPYYTVYTSLAEASRSHAACFTTPAGFDPARRVLRTAVLVRLTPAAVQQTHIEVGALAYWRYAQERTWRELDDHGAYQQRMSKELRARIDAMP